jgi:3-dehydroquinate dehydratase
MNNLSNKIIAYLGRTPDFISEVKLQNEGSGVYIAEWNVDGVAKPTDEQLDALSSQAETLEKNNLAIANRQIEYGSPEKMIEYITENGLEAWQSKVQEIKTKYPKENS